MPSRQEVSVGILQTGEVRLISFVEEVLTGDSKFDAVVCLEGKGSVKCADAEVSLKPGDSVFVPASKDSIVFEGTMKVLLCHI